MDLNTTANFIKRSEEEEMAKSLAKSLSLPYINLEDYPITQEVINIFSKELALLYQAVPYLKVQNEVRIGALNPENEDLNKYLKAKERETGLRYILSVTSKTSFGIALRNYDKFEKEKHESSNIAPKDTINIIDIQTAAEAAKNTTITELLEVVVRGAINLEASDIHLEPYGDYFSIRYRIDGVLQDIASLDLLKFSRVLARIKYQAGIRLDIKDKPQDGRFAFQDGDKVVDIRVSIMPSSGGEAIVLRLLGRESLIDNITKLGFRKDAFEAIKRSIGKPHGMIITSGPTGSGKTTTLYAILMTIRKPGVKIISLENPIEYKIDGIEQSQTDEAGGYNFAEALKASLRQDPNVLMVGEVRDAETARVAVEASLTGHLLLTTIHANSAAAVYARLIEIGVESYLLSGSINLIMSQRLVRKVCSFCKEEYIPDDRIWNEIYSILEPIKMRLPEEISRLITENPIRLVRSKGCPKCNNTGFKGRQAVVEYLEPHKDLEEIASKKEGIGALEEKAKSLGLVTMEQDGLLKVLQKITTPEEVWGVTKG